MPAGFGGQSETLRAPTANEIVVFHDETGFTLRPRLGLAWAKGGARLRVPATSQHRGRRTDCALGASLVHHGSDTLT